jgi:hypothetical protein
VGNAGLDVDAQPTGTAPPTAGAGAGAGARARRTARGQLRATCRCRAMERQGLTNHLHVFFSTRHLFGNQKGFQTCFLHRVALLLARGAGVGGAVITLAIAR